MSSFLSMAFDFQFPWHLPVLRWFFVPRQCVTSADVSWAFTLPRVLLVDVKPWKAQTTLSFISCCLNLTEPLGKYLSNWKRQGQRAGTAVVRERRDKTLRNVTTFEVAGFCVATKKAKWKWPKLVVRKPPFVKREDVHWCGGFGRPASGTSGRNDRTLGVPLPYPHHSVEFWNKPYVGWIIT